MTVALVPEIAMPAVPAAWTERDCTEADRRTVLDLFDEADFFYRTSEPTTRSVAEIVDLLGDDTRVLLADGVPVGLYACEDDNEHDCHFVLHLRLSASAPKSWWLSVYREIAGSLLWSKDLVRITMKVGEFDRRGQEFARTAGLTDEGTLAGVVRHDGGRHGYVYFSQVWEPAS